jgi:hypothetical protein
MQSLRDNYNVVTTNASDSQKQIDLNKRYTAVRFKSMHDGEKWAIKKGEVPLFDKIGVLPDLKSVVVGEDRGSLYLIRMQNNPRPVCRAKSYQSYRDDKFIWVMGGAGELADPIINQKGQFLVHLPTNKYIECSEPPEMIEFGKKFELSDKTTIYWKGSRFEKETQGRIETDEENSFDIKDVRKDKLEEFLEENVDLDIIKGASNMDEVDMSETPEPMVEVFYNMGDGDFPADPDGDFEPPDQDEFAIEAYERFKRKSENKEAFRDENRNAWIKRLKNAWASLIRDVHFSFMMYEEQSSANCFDEVEFDKQKDIEEGIDFLVKNDGVEYHINLFINSKKSRRFLDKKKKYRQPSTDAVAIEVPMQFYGDQKKSIQTEGSELWLYSEEHINGVKEIVLGDEDKVTRNDVVVCEKMGEVN